MKLIIASALLSAGISAPQMALSQLSILPNRQIRDARGTDKFDVISGVSRQNIDSSGSNIAGSKPEDSLDAGVLHGGLKDLHGRRVQASECPERIDCVGGFTGDGDIISCADACGKDCCTGDLACDGFTGSVCKDGASCIGDKSCFFAVVSDIVQGCNGTKACYGAGYGGIVNEIVNSCIGDYSCGYAAAYGGFIGSIQDSCVGYLTCYAAGQGDNPYDNCADGGQGGNIGFIQDSCLGDKSCYRTGKCGVIGSIQDSCVGLETCQYAAYEGDI